MCKLAVSVLSFATIIGAAVPYNVLAEEADSCMEISQLQSSSEAKEGMWGTCKWKICGGVLTIHGGEGLGSDSKVFYKYPWSDYKDIINSVVIDGDVIFKDKDVRGLFSNLNNVRDITGLSHLKFTVASTNISEMFQSDYKLISIGSDMFDWSNVQTADSIFQYCNYLQSVDLRGINTENLKSINDMFCDDGRLEYVNLQGLDLSQVTNMRAIFNRCGMLKEVNLSGVKTGGNLKEFSVAFNGCKTLEYIDLSSINLDSVGKLEYTFKNCSSLKGINWGSNTLPNVDYFYETYMGCDSLTSAYFNKPAKGITRVIEDCSSLKQLDLGNLYLDESNKNDGAFNMVSLNNTKVALESVMYPTKVIEGSAKVRFDKALTVALKDGNWKDETVGTVYTGKPTEFVAGHKYIYMYEEVKNGLCQAEDGNWYYYADNEVDADYNRLAQNEYGWWKVTNGIVDFGYTGLADNIYGTWKVVNGAVDFTANGLQYDETTGKWWYFNGGAVDYSYAGLALNEYGWWKITGGAVDFNYTGMAENEYGWWYVTDGAVDFGYTGLSFNQYGWWYLENGTVNFDYTGLKPNEYGWWYVTDGYVDFGYTGLAYDEAVGWWYVTNGMIDFGYTGVAENEYGVWNVVNGAVVF